MSTECQKTTAKAIPSTKRVTINNADHMPHDYSTTPGGTLFSTTPGGMYRNFKSFSNTKHACAKIYLDSRHMGPTSF